MHEIMGKWMETLGLTLVVSNMNPWKVPFTSQAIISHRIFSISIRTLYGVSNRCIVGESPQLVGILLNALWKNNPKQF